MDSPLVRCLLIGAGAVAIQAVVLLILGQPAICTCGFIKLWHGAVGSPENSQHLVDWYTFSHVIHGFGFYLLGWLVAPRAALATRFTLAIALEAGWEILENTPLIIERYRQSALAQGYFGDSVVNSVFDSVAMAAGFGLARLLPLPLTIALALAMELFVAYQIRDNLLLNIVQLLFSSETISVWQARP